VYHILIITMLCCACCVQGYANYDGKTVPPLPTPSNVVYCTTAIQFRMALLTQTANRSIVLMNGVYNVANYEPLSISASGLSIRGITDDPNGAVIVGKGMNNCVDVEEDMFRMVGGSNVTFANLTITESRCHGVKFQSGATSHTVFHNVHFLNIGERMIKGPATLNAPGCTVRYCLFEDTIIPPSIRCGSSATDSSGDYIAAMDIMAADSWVIHDNVFLNIKGPNGQGRAAVFLWNGNVNMVTERNTFIGCDKSISYGNLSGATASVTGGIIRNNFIIPGTACGIELIDAVNIKAYNNTSFTALTLGNGPIICARTQGCEIKNNIIFGGFAFLEGPTPDTSRNIAVTRTLKTVVSRWFADEAQGKLHLKTDTASAVNTGLALAEITSDWDNLPRSDGHTDIGADELSNNATAVNFAAIANGEPFLAVPQPNPFNPSTTVWYGIPTRGIGKELLLTVTTPDGKLVKTLKQGQTSAGTHSAVWDGTTNTGKKASSGTYLFNLNAGEYHKTVKAILAK